MATSDPSKPRVLLMGARRSGKSSIQKVVFHKMSPHETLFLEVLLSSPPSLPIPRQ